MGRFDAAVVAHTKAWQRVLPMHSCTRTRARTRMPHIRLLSSFTSGRPTAPFLSAHSRQLRAYFTVKKRKFRQHEIKLFFRFAAGWLGFLVIVVPAATMALKQYQVDHLVPVPSEWSTTLSTERKHIMDLLEPGAIGSNGQALRVFASVCSCLDMLESWEWDGEGVQTQPHIIKKYGLLAAGLDVSMKSEEWRREYYTLLMSAARAAEYVPYYSWDTRTNSFINPTLITTPENPDPPCRRRHYHEDCVESFIVPENFYRKIMTTKGFNEKQKLDAMLLCATFLDFKGRSSEAEEIFTEAFALVSKNSKVPLFDPKTLILNEDAGPPSENLLNVLTEYLTLKAQKKRLNVALPAMISILKARRSLPNYPPLPTDADALLRHRQPSILEQLHNTFRMPAYPPPPPDGSQPPWRSPEELCEEAKLSIYIGEMMFAGTHKEDGIVWTREGIDSAEAELEALWKDDPTASVRAATAACRQCLIVGFKNWAQMTEVMLQAQKERDAAAWEHIKDLRHRLMHGEIPWWERWWRGLSLDDVNARFDQARRGKSDRWIVERRLAFAKQTRDRDILQNVRPPPVGWLALFRTL
ncbi:hypothetical protein CFIMG_003396RAa [Ceratocystis fimbriata CBS 114723]|uniref:Uncharacterized protein n=1 Tax=Ceratocystis fimbriata CBS 114723 TaxID=1035309 RepID=A0A2C5XBK5_9PEZI|nr:hypothetical protein CFIMG_003396RAa [Ceratocystis fimbriata CBS 114723]